MPFLLKYNVDPERRYQPNGNRRPTHSIKCKEKIRLDRKVNRPIFVYFIVANQLSGIGSLLSIC